MNCEGMRKDLARTQTINIAFTLKGSRLINRRWSS